MTVATISIGKRKPERMRIPDGFTFSIKKDGNDFVAEYVESIIESRDEYTETAGWFVNFCLSRGYDENRIRHSWADGVTKMTTIDHGNRKDLLSGIFTEIVAQLKCCLSDRQVENLTRIITVFDCDDEEGEYIG